MKATQVYPAGFGKNIQKAQRKLKDDSKKSLLKIYAPAVKRGSLFSAEFSV